MANEKVRIQVREDSDDHDWIDVGHKTGDQSMPVGLSSTTLTSISNDIDYNINDVDDYTTTSVTYIGLEKSDGTWWIKKLDETGTYLTVNHATITNNATLTTYATAWAARTTATYNDFSGAF